MVILSLAKTKTIPWQANWATVVFSQRYSCIMIIGKTCCKGGGELRTMTAIRFLKENRTIFMRHTWKMPKVYRIVDWPTGKFSKRKDAKEHAKEVNL